MACTRAGVKTVKETFLSFNNFNRKSGVTGLCGLSQRYPTEKACTKGSLSVKRVGITARPPIGARGETCLVRCEV